MRARLIRFGFAFLDATTRTWGAFWGTLAVWAAYWIWNAVAPAPDRFDPFPFIFLTLLITMASYLQNIVLMTDQRVTNARIAEVQARQDRGDEQRLHLMEAVVSLCNVLVDHAEKAQRRDEESIARDGKIMGMLERRDDRKGRH